MRKKFKGDDAVEFEVLGFVDHVHGIAAVAL